MTMSWDRLLCDDRLQGGAGSRDGRSEYQRDYDRLVFSDAFRVLQRKTQVHPMPASDTVHNRLTHTLEVSCIGRSLGEAAGQALKARGELPERIQPSDLGAIVQAACLAHDVGNPPFGHAGEFAIREWYRKAPERYFRGVTAPERADLQTFDGNAQGFRIITQLGYNPGQGGMRLTYATLSTFLKYPWCSADIPPGRAGKFSVFRSEAAIFREVCRRTGLVEVSSGVWCRHPLAYLLEAADDICYALIDVEDGIELGILSVRDFEDLILPILPPGHVERYRELGAIADRQRIWKLRGMAMEILVEGTIRSFLAAYPDIIAGVPVPPITDTGDPAVARCLHVAKKELGQQRIFKYARKTEIEIGAYAAVDVLLTACCDAALAIHEDTANRDDDEQLPFKARRINDLLETSRLSKADGLYGSYLKINDFLASLSDERASYLAKQLSGHVH
ncbi:deoxyguanosinetriphosphate triphosphohydrolase [Arenibaculum sp.]|jgi:dGTPase|uniref:deoxyguanosinetriphosphate triphosphohydrolase n=1 Tax=Arenibaculum sp. TaxID=2865862 RepID=UPI002E163F95|nr:deoxyguanosinetriphosphate triphosphohydrolase [Arenibaculum sp.]